MKLIESKAEYIPQEEGLEGIYKQIELAGRTAYHSLDKITSDSAKDFVDRMIKSKHGAALEHGTVYLKMFSSDCRKERYAQPEYTGKCRYTSDFYSKCTPRYHEVFGVKIYDEDIYVSTNYRVLIENNWLDDLQYQCSPTEFHEKRYTMRFTCSRAIAQELTRHRTFSFLMESQRYINYSKERHGGEITFIIPSWFQTLKEKENYDGEIRDGSNRIVIGGKTFQLSSVQGFEEHYMCSRLSEAEHAYFHFLKQGYTPQQARDILPNATKTELIMTGFSSDWKFLMDLRLFEKTGAVHPDMKDLMQKAQKVMQEAGIWEDIMSKPSKFE